MPLVQERIGGRGISTSSRTEELIMAKKEQPRRILTIPVVVDVDMIMDGLQALDHDQLFEFIVQADLVAADYDFTKRLRDHFVKEIDTMDKEEPSLEKQFVMYEVRNMDTLSQIAERFGTSVRRIQQLNRIPNSAHIEPGWLLLIPRKK
jgi:LysM repeat protein